MAMGPRLDLRQTQKLVMTQQMQQAVQLLTLSSLEIEAYIAGEVERNPLLENADQPADGSAEDHMRGGDIADSETYHDTGDPLLGDNHAVATDALDVDFTETTFHHDSPLDSDMPASERANISQTQANDYAAGGGGDGPDWNQIGDGDITLHDHLRVQAGAMFFGQEEFLVMQLIGELDANGYLSADFNEMAYRLGVDSEDLEDALYALQLLDPTGVGARDLAECLALQAQAADRYDPCIQTLIAHLDLIGTGQFDKLKRLCRVDDEDLKDMLSELRGYDPKPGARFGGEVAQAVTPDMFVTARTNKNGEVSWYVELNSANLPRLLVNRSYMAEFAGTGADKKTKQWLNECLEEANWLIRAMDQRQKTILKVAGEIIQQQQGFFREGIAALRPLTLRQVADVVDMHESTVSRVTSNKYLSCDRGLFDLKYFFSSGVASADGEGASAEAVKAAIKILIDGEGAKILSDDKLAELLKVQGYDLARRTVAKYREAMGIGSGVQRRRQLKMRG